MSTDHRLSVRFVERLLSLPIPALLASTYFIWILTGTGLLLLPFASTSGISFSDAFFTATSAVTVTGLVVFDPGQDLTLFGQIVLMILIQLGGLGLMTFACVLLSSLGLEIGIVQQNYLREELGLNTQRGLVSLAWVIFRIVIIGECLGFLLLMRVFVPDFGWAEGAWMAAFHAVSAFNNAGFSLFSDSLMGYQTDITLIYTISTMFIVGGLGFAVLSDIWVQRKWKAFSLHTRLMLSGTLGLLILSYTGYLVLEWANPLTLGSLDSVSARFHAAWFESVTPRTAGFNTLDTSAMNDSTTLMTMVLMVIGGGSTSTAGGIKVTTALLLLLATVAFFRNSGRIHAFGYRIDLEQGIKVMALLTVSILLIILGLFLILVTHEVDFLVAAFEVCSAFGTVGLSQGLTSDLNAFGRFIICVIMFLGRVGPLTLGFFLISKSSARVKRPQGTIFLG